MVTKITYTNTVKNRHSTYNKAQVKVSPMYDSAQWVVPARGDT